MSLVSARQLTLQFGGLQILRGADLQIEERERICLLGRNGAGKTTLLKVIAGQVSPDDGTLEFRQGIRIGALPQEIPDNLEGTALTVACSGASDTAMDEEEALRSAESVLSRLSVEKDAPFTVLSGGMKRRVLLARALCGEPDLLLLDEPTNHLDIGTIEWLEGFLLRQDTALLYVSHDRAFADAVSTKIVELDRGVLSAFPGNYSAYTAKKAEALEIEARVAEKFDKKLAAEEAWIRKGIKARRTRNEGRVRALEKMREARRARVSSMGSVNLSASLGASKAKRMIVAENASFAFPEKPIVTGLDTVIQRGDKVGIIGPNGAGKTTLLRLLLGDLVPSGGTIKRADAKVAYLDQLHGDVDDAATLIENLAGKGDTVTVDGKSRHIISYLQDFLFSAEAARAPAKMLSGGERNRLLLAKLFTKPADILVLDEPTNDLDTDTLELLESLLVSYEGTVLLVSHDRAFLNNVVSGTLVFEGEGRVVEYAGGYDDWLAQRTVETPEKKPKKKEKRTQKSEGPRRLSFKEKQELEGLPGRIETLEEELEALRAQAADPAFYQQDKEVIKSALARMEALEPELAEIYARWEFLESLQ